MYTALTGDDGVPPELLARMCLGNGLPRLRHGHSIGAAGIGWRAVFDRIGPGDPAPLMPVYWPVLERPLIHGVRKDSPTG